MNKRRVLSVLLVVSLLFFNSSDFYSLDSDSQTSVETNTQDTQKSNIPVKKETIYQKATAKLANLGYEVMGLAFLHPLATGVTTLGVIFAGSFFAGVVYEIAETEGWTPLHRAAANGDLGKLLKSIKEHPEWIDLQDGKGRTPIDVWAAYNSNSVLDTDAFKDIGESWLSLFLQDEKGYVIFDAWQRQQQDVDSRYAVYCTEYERWVAEYKQKKLQYDMIKQSMKKAALSGNREAFEALCKEFKNISWYMRAGAGFSHDQEISDCTDPKNVSKKIVNMKYVPSMGEFWECVSKNSDNDGELNRIFGLAGTN